MAEPVSIEAIEHTIRHSALPGLGFAGLLGIALIHLLDVISKMNETPYVGVIHTLLMGASISVAFLILHRGSRGLDSGRAAGGNDPDRVRPQPHDRVAKREPGRR
jgi:hypothetical protein